MLTSKEISMTPFLHSIVSDIKADQTSIVLDGYVVVLKRDNGEWRAFEVTGMADTDRSLQYAAIYLPTMSVERLVDGSI